MIVATALNQMMSVPFETPKREIRDAQKFVCMWIFVLKELTFCIC